MRYQLGWSTLPGLKGISVSEFRLTPTDAPDNERGVAMAFADQRECEAFLREIESAFARRRFTNAADAFDTVKAWALERLGKMRGGLVS
jgi:hypothetical protein